MSQHTPGPKWECLGTDDGALVICARDAHGKRRTIAHVYQDASARLIAKAPEMLASIEHLRAAVETLSGEVVYLLTGPQVHPGRSAAKWAVVNDALVESSALLREIEGETT